MILQVGKIGSLLQCAINLHRIFMVEEPLQQHMRRRAAPHSSGFTCAQFRATRGEYSIAHHRGDRLDGDVSIRALERKSTDAAAAAR